MVIFGLANAGMVDTLIAQYGIEPAAYTNNVGASIWRGIFVYAAFQCVSIPPMIAASNEMGTKGTGRACFLGWLMNGLALGLSGFTLSKWYPLLMGLQNAKVDGFLNATGIPNQTMLTLIGMKVLLVAFSILLFCAFVSTCVTLIFTMVQRFAPKLAKFSSEGEFISGIQNETLRRVIVAVIAIALCFAISLLGLTNITKLLYGYDGYYALVVVVLPAFIWGIPKIKKLQAQGKKA